MRRKGSYNGMFKAMARIRIESLNPNHFKYSSCASILPTTLRPPRRSHRQIRPSTSRCTRSLPERRTRRNKFLTHAIKQTTAAKSSSLDFLNVFQFLTYCRASIRCDARRLSAEGLGPFMVNFFSRMPKSSLLQAL